MKKVKKNFLKTLDMYTIILVYLHRKLRETKATPGRYREEDMKTKYLPYAKVVSWSDRDTTEYDFFFPAGIEVTKAPQIKILAKKKLAGKIGSSFEELPELLEESPELREELKGLISKYKTQFPTPDEIIWVEVDKERADALGLVKRAPWESLPSVGYCNLPNFPEIEAIYKEAEEARISEYESIKSALELVKKAALDLGLSVNGPHIISDRGTSYVHGYLDVYYMEDGYRFQETYKGSLPGDGSYDAIVADLRRWEANSRAEYAERKRKKAELADFYENQRKSSLEKGEVAKLSSGMVVKIEADGFTVRVPDWAVPHLIGKGGQKIKAASQALGRRIKLVSYPDQNKPRKAQAWWLI